MNEKKEGYLTNLIINNGTFWMKMKCERNPMKEEELDEFSTRARKREI